MGILRQLPWVDSVRRMVATFCSLVVLALGIFAASPVLHHQLHDAAATGFDDGCAIVLFASGVSLAVALIAPAPGSADRHRARPATSIELLLNSPCYLLRPERGPPLS